MKPLPVIPASAQEVAQIIRHLAAEAGSQSALARRWKVSRAHICDLCRGTRHPGPRLLKKLRLAKRVTTTVEYLPMEDSGDA